MVIGSEIEEGELTIVYVVELVFIYQFLLGRKTPELVKLFGILLFTITILMHIIVILV